MRAAAYELIKIAKKIGRQTAVFDKKICIDEVSCIASQKEAEGTLGKSIDKIIV